MTLPVPSSSGRAPTRVARYAAAATLLLSATASADAASPDVAVALDWSEHEGCATVEQERAALAALTGRFAESDAAHASFTIHVDFERAAREEPAPRVDRPGWSVAASAFGLENVGLLPVPATGVGLSVRVTPPGWLASFFASADLFAPRDSYVGPIGLTMGAWYATVGVCPVRAASRFLRWDACAALAGGVMTAGGLDLQTVRTAAPMLVGAEVSSSLDVRVVGPLSAGFFVSALVPFGSHRFYATDNGAEIELHETWPVIPSAGLELRVTRGT